MFHQKWSLLFIVLLSFYSPCIDAVVIAATCPAGQEPFNGTITSTGSTANGNYDYDCPQFTFVKTITIYKSSSLNFICKIMFTCADADGANADTKTIDSSCAGSSIQVGTSSTGDYTYIKYFNNPPYFYLGPLAITYGTSNGNLQRCVSNEYITGLRGTFHSSSIDSISAYCRPKCSSCTPGTYSSISSNVPCTSCSAGTSSDFEATDCASCSVGTYSHSGAYSCTSCPTGTYSDSGASICTSCSGATYSSITGASFCTACLAGTYFISSISPCSTCIAGTFSLSGATACTSCSGSTYSSITGASTCTACLAGTYFSSSTLPCPQCSVGTTSIAGASSCISCPAV